MQIIRDQVKINYLQRLLKRELTHAEKNGQELIHFRDKNGQLRTTRVRWYALRNFYTK